MDSTLGDTISNVLRRNTIWGEDALDRIKLLVYSGTQLLVISMAAFFFLFLYYCAFGFVMESVSESKEESVTKIEDASAPEHQGDTKEQEMKSEAESRDGNQPAKKEAADMGFGLFD